LNRLSFLSLTLLLMTSCTQKLPERPAFHDPHSYANAGQVRVRHLNLDLDVLFDQRTVRGTAVLTIDRFDPNARQLILDSQGLQIDETEVSADASKYREARFTLGKRDAILGAPFAIDIAQDTKYVRIRYSSSPTASALQWLEPEQTAGKQKPFLYTQSEAIHARSWLPVQDSPSVRVTYEARVHVPAGMKAVMSATNCPDSNDCRFVMDKPIPSYLIALAVGDLAFRPTGPRTGVWAEPPVVDKAANEFSDMENMLKAAETLYGPYQWGRYDVLVLPPSFPYGGMENPRLTFATPTVIAGDKSLVSLVAHELAHSWSGNLVTNATWSDFWLNEGYTVYSERRILEQLYGKKREEMEAVLGYQDLQEDLKTLKPADQILNINLDGRDPDDGMTDIPYEKGALFLTQLEQKFGREKFDAYLKGYFDHFAFQSITTAQSLAWMRAHLFAEDEKAETTIPVNEWVYQPGLPASAPKPVSEAFTEINRQIPLWLAGQKIDTSGWVTQQWLYFLRGLPEHLQNVQMTRLDAEYHFTGTPNDEVLDQWLLMVVRNHYQPASQRLEEFLTTVGRIKYVKPLYKAMDLKQAKAIYEKARPMYHPITQASIDAVLAKKEKPQGS
jgi:leukotriene A-4 hydrolase/aminopeptidase